jgi:hypothetical protein
MGIAHDGTWIEASLRKCDIEVRIQRLRIAGARKITLAVASQV